jgi:hypothetical protein
VIAGYRLAALNFQKRLAVLFETGIAEFCGIKRVQKFIVDVLFVIGFAFGDGIAAIRTGVIYPGFRHFQGFQGVKLSQGCPPLAGISGF